MLSVSVWNDVLFIIIINMGIGLITPVLETRGDSQLSRLRSALIVPT